MRYKARMGEKRTVCLNIRVSDTEKAALQRAADSQGISFAELIRRSAKTAAGVAHQPVAQAKAVARSVEIYSTRDLGPDQLAAPHPALHA